MFRSAVSRPVSLSTSSLHRSALSAVGCGIFSSRPAHSRSLGSCTFATTVPLAGSRAGPVGQVHTQTSLPSIHTFGRLSPRRLILTAATSSDEPSGTTESKPAANSESSGSVPGTQGSPKTPNSAQDDAKSEGVAEAGDQPGGTRNPEPESARDPESSTNSPSGSGSKKEKKLRMAHKEAAAAKRQTRKAEKKVRRAARKEAAKALKEADGESEVEPTAATTEEGDTETKKESPKVAKSPKSAKPKSAKKTDKSGDKKGKKQSKESATPLEVQHARRGSKAIHPVTTVSVKRINLNSVDNSNSEAPRVSHGLDRVLFNPGVHYMQDPWSGVYNFDPYIEKIMPVKEFDFGATMRYIKPSDDTFLHSMAKNNDLKYLSSSSNMTGLLEQLHYLISSWRPLNLSRMSNEFDIQSKRPTMIARAASIVNLRWKDGTYAIDKAKDPELDNPTILSLFGNLLEKALISPPEEFEKYRKNSVEKPSNDVPDGFLYTNYGKLLWRSQLDAMDPRLPGTGVFDLKSRAVVSLRFHNNDYQRGLGYELVHPTGNWLSYEREYHDMARATMLKYLLQVRLGRMDGIFVAYHNIERLFGFQYLSKAEMDYIQHGQTSPELGNQEFHASLHILNEALEHITKKFPGQTVRISFETREAVVPFTYIFAEPVSDAELDEVDNLMAKRERKWQASVLGEDPAGEEDAEETTATAEDADGSWQKMKDLVDMEIQRDGLVSDNNVPDLNTALTDALVESRAAKVVADNLREAIDAVFDRATDENGQVAKKEKAVEEEEEDEVEEDEEAEAEVEEEDDFKAVTAEETVSLVTELRTRTARLTITLEKLDDSIEIQSDEVSSLARGLIKDIPAQIRMQTELLAEIEPRMDELERLAEEEEEDVEEDEEVEESGEEEDVEEEGGVKERGPVGGVPSEAADAGIETSFVAGTDTAADLNTSVPGTSADSESTSASSTDAVESESEFSSAPTTPADSETRAETATKGESDAGAEAAAAAAAAAKHPPLYGMVLTIRNRVDGVYVDRPKEVTADTDWKIEYCFSEITDPGTAWRNYQMLHSRRKKALSKKGGDDWFLGVIASRVEESKAIRRKKDEAEARDRDGANGRPAGPVVYEPWYKGSPAGPNMSFRTSRTNGGSGPKGESEN